MKFRILTLVVALIAVSAVAVQAQSSEEPAVKIIRTKTPGVIKVIYAIETLQPVTVKFITDRGIATSHEVRGIYPKGWLKRYNVSSIDNKDFWIEISSPQQVLKYRVTAKDGNAYTSLLETSTYNHLMVRKNN